MPLPNPENKLFYLASPYSHANKMVMDYRYFLVAAAAAVLYNLGFNLLEPIGSGHPIATKYDLPKGYEYWMKRDRLMISRSDGVIVLTAPGWAESKGVTDEVNYAKSLGLPVFYVNPGELLPADVLATEDRHLAFPVRNNATIAKEYATGNSTFDQHFGQTNS